jgi:hypothetical protein
MRGATEGDKSNKKKQQMSYAMHARIPVFVSTMFTIMIT